MHASLLSLALLSAAATTSAVQLANFQSIVIDNAQCRAAYTTNIDGCQQSDFAPKASAQCTDACIAGLRKIGDVVKRVCKDVDVGETSIIGVFQNDIGIRALCPVLATPSSSPPPAAASSAPARPPPQQTQAQSSRAATSTSPSSTLETSATSTSSSSEVAQASSSSAGGLLIDANPSSAAVGSQTDVGPPVASSTAGAAPSRAANAQLSNADSGGGSPFDVVAVGGAGSRVRAVGALVGAALVVGVVA